MTYSPYTGDFTCWADVAGSFACNEPEPEEVLLADYENDGYEGSAHVVYRNGNTYYVIEGSHCSCYGLEGQFQPESYD